MGGRYLHANGNPIRTRVQSCCQGPERLGQHNRSPTMKEPVGLGVPGYGHPANDTARLRLNYLDAHALHERSIGGDTQPGEYFVRSHDLTLGAGHGQVQTVSTGGKAPVNRYSSTASSMHVLPRVYAVCPSPS